MGKAETKTFLLDIKEENICNLEGFVCNLSRVNCISLDSRLLCLPDQNEMSRLRGAINPANTEHKSAALKRTTSMPTGMVTNL